jgi:hypothetical protein
MRKLYPLFISMLFSAGLSAQPVDEDIIVAKQLITANRVSLGLSPDDINNLAVLNSYKEDNTGIRYVYAQQTHKGIPVYNQIQVFTFRNDVPLSKTGDRIASIEQKVNVSSGVPLVTAEAAVIAAIADRNLIAKEAPVAITVKDNGHFKEFGNLRVSRENITARLLWVPDEYGKSLQLAWQVYIIPQTTSDYWLVRMSAVNGQFIGADNLTVYCDWSDPGHTHHSGEDHHHFTGVIKNTLSENIEATTEKNTEKAETNSAGLPLADNATYRVIPFPYEAPTFMPGPSTTWHALRTNPWTAGSANATTLKWHSTNATGTDYNYTRGNNVWAYHDRNNQNNGDPARSATSTTPLPNLTFDFTPDYTEEPIVTSPPNQQFNITNLFYWNNIIHNILYEYGFDEAAGNFQTNNLGRGGSGNDHILAEAQDGSGSNNANFSTPADGSSGRMQMYLWTNPNPDRDGDVDNGIIVHEYGHGVSNRLTGGRTTASCLNNAEQMGEGWSDYFALMLTQNWAASNLNTGFTNPRGIGTYALNQPTTGVGIRSQKYSTDFSINNRVYTSTLSTSPHNRGEIWCATLWDMTWNIIQQNGTINPNIYDLAGGGGNNIAMKLVMEGMKLQPCSPGFIDGRNAILQADLNLYGGAYQCAIKEAFRRRGMGEGASQGSSNSVTDQVPSFAGGSSSTLTLLQNGVTSTPEGQHINYTNRLVVGNCGDLVNYRITDTLPSNVTFVSATNGGTYNAANRVVSWTVNQAANSTVDYNFVVSINSGAYYPTVTLINETVTGSSIPASWTTTATPTNNLWTVSSAQSKSPPNSFFTSNLTTTNDQRLFTTNSMALPANPVNLTFWGYINSEQSWDGGVVEISTNGGTNWTDLGSNMTSGGYNGSLLSSPNPLSGRQAFTGNSSGFVKTTVNLAPYANQANVKFRFRFGSDGSVGGVGWYVDDILIQDVAQVAMRSNLFNASGVRLSFSDANMLIDPPTGGCTAPGITAHPSGSTLCAGANTSFTVTATGTEPLSYQWELSTNGGASYSNVVNGGIYSGAATATLTLTGVTSGLNGNRYRCVVTGACAPAATSNPAILTVTANVSAGTINGTSPLCIGQTSAFTSNGTAGGEWSSSNNAIATVNSATGLVAAVSEGTCNIIYTVNSGCGSPVSASMPIDVITCSAPSITCPDNISASVTTGCNTSIAVPNPVIAGTSTLTWIMSGATTGSSAATGINYVGTGSFNIGVTTVTYTAHNAAGASATCSFTVTVTDNPDPPIVCPANITNVQNGKNKCSASINVPNPNTSSNCSVTKLTWAMTGAVTLNSPATGVNYVGTQTFPVGVTTITYSLTNGGGFTSTCSFTVTVSNNKCPGSPVSPFMNNETEKATDKLIVQVSPNPSESYFTLRVQSASRENVEVAVYTMGGTLIQKLHGSVFESFRFGGSYRAGTYIVKVTQGDQQVMVKVVR